MAAGVRRECGRRARREDRNLEYLVDSHASRSSRLALHQGELPDSHAVLLDGGRLTCNTHSSSRACLCVGPCWHNSPAAAHAPAAASSQKPRPAA